MVVQHAFGAAMTRVEVRGGARSDAVRSPHAWTFVHGSMTAVRNDGRDGLPAASTLRYDRPLGGGERGDIG